MKFPQNLNGDDLELILLQNIRDIKKNDTFFLRINRLLQNIIATLKKEPLAKVGQIKDYLGNTIWCVYDPITGQSARLSSKVEVRLWLEERYYQVNEKMQGLETTD